MPNPVRDDVFKNPCMDSRVQSSNAASSVESSKQNRFISVARLDPQKNPDDDSSIREDCE